MNPPASADIRLERREDTLWLWIDREARRNSLNAAVLAGIGMLVRRHLVICVLMNDAAVANALAHTPLTVADAYRTSIAMSLSDERTRTIATLRSAGVIALDVPAKELSVKLIDAYLDVKARGLI